jgi:hypothetical protein
MSSAATLIAISSGVSAPMAMPMGQNTRLTSSLVKPLRQKLGKDGISLFPAADHPDIVRLGAQGLAQHLFVEPMAPGNDNHGAIGRRCQSREHFGIAGAEANLIGGGKALGVGEFSPVIKNHDGEAKPCNRFTDSLSDMTGADDIEGLGGQNLLTYREAAIICLHRRRGRSSASTIGLDALFNGSFNK